jgi:tetratricopeptide (TPR) repeat protein
LADAYFYAYEEGSISAKGLERCIDHSITILERGKPEDRYVTRCKMGQYYAALYGRDRVSSDLNAAIDNLKVGLKGKLRRETRRWAILELSRALSKKYERSRDKEHLDSAIHWSRVALHENPDDASILRMFGNLCHWNYKESGDVLALDESIECYQKAWTIYQAKQGLNMPMFYYSFGSVLLRRYDKMKSTRKENMEDVERAIELLQLAVRNASSRDLDEFRHRLSGAIARQRDSSRRDSSHKGPQSPRSAPLVAYTILPQELDRLLAKGKLSVLVLDARPRLQFEMERIDHDAILCLEPTLLTRPRY